MLKERNRNIEHWERKGEVGGGGEGEESRYCIETKKGKVSGRKVFRKKKIL